LEIYNTNHTDLISQLEAKGFLSILETNIWVKQIIPWGTYHFRLSEDKTKLSIMCRMVESPRKWIDEVIATRMNIREIKNAERLFSLFSGLIILNSNLKPENS
jgi:hypothetical protein